MTQLISARQHIIGFYKKFEAAINYIGKFIVGLFVFSQINTLGMYREEFNVLFASGATQFSYLVLMALLFTISSPTIGLFLAAVAIAIQLSAVLEVAFFVFLLLMLIIIFYARLAPRNSILILAMVIGFYFRMPYVVVLFAGLYFGATAMIPVIFGTAVWHFLPFFTNLAQTVEVVTDFDLFELPITFLEVFAQIFAQLTTDFNWIIQGFVFAMIVLAVHLISRISINYSKDIAIAVGTIVGIICMTMVVLVIEIDMSIGGVFASAIFSAVLVWIAKFFEGVADYERVERVVFDDDDNYYYVKIVPKVTPEKNKTAAKPAATSKPAPVAAKPAAPRPVTPRAVAPRPPAPKTGRANPALIKTEDGYRSKLLNPRILEDEE